VPLVREEGEVTIIPIVEEVLVIEKRLILKEEVHIRRVRVPDVHREVVTLRTQDVVVERTKPGETRRTSPLELAPIPGQQALKE
jgi:stress response protein YsnF